MANQSIVFVHGLGLGPWLFEKHFQPFYAQQGLDVYLVELPQHFADSDKMLRQRVTLDNCIEKVKQAINENIQQDFVLVGMSMGGAITQKLLSSQWHHPHLRGAVLLSSVPPVNNLLFTLRLCRQLALQKPSALIDFFSGQTNIDLMFSNQSIVQLGDQASALYQQRVLTGFSRLEYELFFQDLITVASQSDTTSSDQRLSDKPLSATPLCVIGGEQDQLFPPDVTQFIANYYSVNATLLPELGHLIPIEPGYAAGIHAINTFLNEVF
ncbi:alpha/beta hydrolase [Aliikangiella maris]|uniref:Alpha/beta hydrolase n=2 Tax=Aliikangiella maris TaxID=3162458 RepID=A0ABV2BXY8_9GAMM